MLYAIFSQSIYEYVLKSFLCENNIKKEQHITKCLKCAMPNYL